MGGVINPGGGGGGGGSGDVNGPASSTNDALTRFDGTGGKTIQNSVATLSDAGSLQINNTGAGFSITDNGTNGPSLGQYNHTLLSASSSTTDRVSINDTRAVAGGGTDTDDYETLHVKRSVSELGGGTYNVQGSVAHFEKTIGGAFGTLTDDAPVLKLTQATASQAGHLNLANDITAGNTVDGDLFRTSAGLQYNDGGTEHVLVGRDTTDTLTNKTFDANGTGNSLSNVDVADLANGTDGELITWDASGAPATVATGTAGHVLTSNGAGAAPTFQAAAGGGGFADWKTIGSGGDYADVQAMIDDSQYRGVLIADVTEDSDIVPDANGLWLNLNGYTLTTGTNRIDPSAACQISIIGNGPDSEIDYTFSVEQPFIDSNSSSYNVVLDNFTVDNNSSVKDTRINHGAERLAATRLWFNIPSVSTTANSSLGLEFQNDQSWCDGIVFTSDGAAADVALSCFSTSKISNVHFAGNWAASTSAGQIDSTEGIFTNISTESNIALSIGGTLNGLEAGSTVTIVPNANYTILTNLRSQTTGSNIDFDGSNNDFVTISNCHFDDFSMTSTSASNWSISNCRIDNSVTVGGDYHQWSNNEFDSSVTINATALRNNFSNNKIAGAVSISNQTIFNGNRVGAEAGGGANTITIAAGTGSVITGNLTDAAISDSGTDTALANNVVY